MCMSMYLDVHEKGCSIRGPTYITLTKVTVTSTHHCRSGTDVISGTDVVLDVLTTA